MDSVWVSVLPSMRDFASTLAKDGQKEADKGGRHLGATMGKAMLAGMAVVAGGAALAGKALYGIGETFDDVTDTIRVGTGATGKNLDALVKSAKNVGTQVPAEFGAIGTTIADVNTRMGLTGPTLEKVASQFLELGRITGEEVDIGKTSAAFNQFGVEGEAVSSSLDRLYTISQATGIGVNDLAAKVTAAGPAAQMLGFSFEETAAMIGNLDKAGLNSSATIAAMQKSLVTLAKDGEKPKDAFNRVVGEIDGFIKAGDEAAALDLAGKVFGTRGAAQFIGAIKSGAVNMADLGTVTGETSDTILEAGEDTADFAEAWQVFKNQVLVAVEPLATKLFTAIGDGMKWINDVGVPAIRSFVDGWSNFTGVGGRVRTQVDEILAGLKDASVVIAVVGGLIAAAFIPHWVALGVAAIASSAKQAAAWVATQAGAIKAAAVHSVQVMRMVGGWVLMGAQAAASAALTLASNARAAGSFVLQRVAMLGSLAVMGAVRLATIAWTATQWLLNAALNANPIGIVVIALVALVAALVWAWNNSETFRAVVMAVWNGIKAAAAAVVDWFVNTALPFLQTFWNNLVAGFTWLKDLVVAAVTLMVDLVVGYFRFWSDLLIGIGRFIWDGLVAGFTWLRDGIVAVVTALVDIVVRSFTFWRDLLVAIVTTIRDWVVERFTWLRDRVLFVVGAMVDYAVTTFTRWRDNVVGLATNIRDWIMERIDALRTRAETTFQNMVDGIGRIWDGLKAVAAAPIRFVIETVINNGIIKGWNDLVGLLKLPDSLKVANLAVPAFARGGILPGQASGRGDNMAVIDRYGRPRATIRSGEAIISEPVTRRNRGVIDHLLAGRDVPAFFMGGTMPTTAGRVSAHPLPYYGAQWAGDLARPMGTPVYAWKDGVIASTARLASSYGWHIRANHNPGQSLYAHLSQIAVAAGQMVRAGQLIGRVGSTGNSTGPHLHFEIRGGAAMQAGDTGGGGGGIFDMVGQWITDKLSAPVKALIDRVPGAGVFVDAAKGMGTRLMDSAIEKIKSLVPAGIFDGSMSGATASGSWQGNANLLMQAGRTLGLSRHAMKIALMTAAQESSMGTNRTAMYRINGDGDVGWFQQRATRGDGTVQQLADPLYGLGVFIHGKRVPAGYHVPGLYNIRGWQSMGLGAAAQRVQVSAYPYAYDKWAGPAEGWLNAFQYDSGGWLPPGVTMTRNDTGRPEAVLTDAQWRALTDRRDGDTFDIDVHTIDSGQAAQRVVDVFRFARA